MTVAKGLLSGGGEMPGWLRELGALTKTRIWFLAPKDFLDIGKLFPGMHAHEKKKTDPLLALRIKSKLVVS